VLITELGLDTFKTWYTAALTSGVTEALRDFAAPPPSGGAVSGTAIRSTGYAHAALWERMTKLVEAAAPRSVPLHKFVKGWAPPGGRARAASTPGVASEAQVNASAPASTKATGERGGEVVMPLLTGMVRLLIDEHQVYSPSHRSGDARLR